MPVFRRIGTTALLMLMLAGAGTAHVSANAGVGSIYLDGKPIAFSADPVVKESTTFVPMRSIFEAQGAKVTWNNKTQTVTAVKGGSTLTYRIGDTVAFINQERLTLAKSGTIMNGVTMVPLRFISEALGNVVQWHAYSGSISISSATNYENTVRYGVNLRKAPSAEENAPVYRLIPKGERIHVIREIDANWLEVQTADKRIGFISAKPLYTDYTSPALTERQADELIAYGSQFFGTPYKFGASSDQTSTFDCSSFVRHVFKEVLSLELPRVSYDQAEKGKEVSVDELRKGDLLFFSARGLPIGHVGIYAGNNQILHTYSKEKGVHIGELDDKWMKRFVTARRVY
ncbi:stalk domain-containing protein [Paenibacillus sp. GCM10027626]|uniref:stalk domain-containing protein n=1 Tax=Paenibacillus sp. GCM10027626 TaxID=3273411 RepID=UPI003634FD29